MKIYNQSSKTLITQKAKLVTSFSDRFLGLLRESNPRCLIFNTRWGIHTLFLKQPIDVLVLNHFMCVVKIKKGLKPFRLYFWNPKYSCVIELPNHYVEKLKINIGDVLMVK